MILSNLLIYGFAFLIFRELGIGIVAYSPLGRGFFSSGPKVIENFSQADFRKVRLIYTRHELRVHLSKLGIF